MTICLRNVRRSILLSFLVADNFLDDDTLTALICQIRVNLRRMVRLQTIRLLLLQASMPGRYTAPVDITYS